MHFVMVVGRDFSFLLLQEYCHDTFKLQRTRWLTLIGTIITQFALGSVYTWSLFNGALSAKLDAR